VTKLLYEEMKREQLRVYKVSMAMIAVASSPSRTTFSLLVSQPGDEQQVGQSHSHPGGLLEGAAANFAEHSNTNTSTARSE
jgi:hypothetical protein